MATSDSPLNIRGGIKGLRFYTREGSNKTYVGNKGGANRELIRKSKKFKRLRLAQNELKGRAQCAKDIRRILGLWSKKIVNRHLQTKIAGVLQQVMNIDEVSAKGKRAIWLSKYKEVLNQVMWYYYKPLNEIMMCPYSVTNSDDKKTLTVTLKGLNPKSHIKAPAVASHFKLCMSIGCVADYESPNRSKFYQRPYGEDACFYEDLESEWIPVNGPLMGDLVLTLSLPENRVIKENYTVIRVLGIVFGKMTYKVDEIARDRGSIVYLGEV
jgi:hypothetical protein